MKSLLIKDTTVDERMAIVKESLNFGDGECEGVDMDDMYDDYIFGRRELADINREFSQYACRRGNAKPYCRTFWLRNGTIISHLSHAKKM